MAETQVAETETEQEVETSAPEPEPKAEPNLEEKLAELSARLEEERKTREQFEEKYRDVSSRLTKVQQNEAEMTRFMKNVLPKINQSKPFAETWEESPEQAVAGVAKASVDPIKEDVEKLRFEHMKAQAELALVSVLADHPEYKTLVPRVRELGDEYPNFTMEGRGGIEKLFKLAAAERPQEAPVDKERTYTESSSAKTPPKKTVKLTSDQLRVAQKFGLTPEQYAKYVR